MSTQPYISSENYDKFYSQPTGNPPTNGNNGTTPTPTPTPTDGGWDWDAFWTGISGMFNTAANTWGNPSYGQPGYYPPQTQNQTTKLLTYGVFALVIIVALAVILKFLK